MKSFPIVVNDKILFSTDVYDYIKHGKTTQAVEYIMNETNCTEKEALEVINDLRELVQQNIKQKIEKMKEPRVQKSQITIDCTQSTQQQNIPHCPTCGSTNIKKISATRKIAGALSFGLLSKTAKSQFECLKCGYKW